MKKRWIAAAAVSAVALAGAAAVKHYPLEAFALYDGVTNPVAEPREIRWSEGPSAPPPGGQRPPNIILIVADDLGINDLSATGTGPADGAVKTPNIDALATQGASFTTGYAANATCSPSRAALLTGRFPSRIGFEFTAVPVAFARNMAAPEPGALAQPIYHSELESRMPAVDLQGVPASETTIAEALKARGYHTIHIGKWHLGEAKPMRPEAQGFDESLGFMSGASKYLDDNDPDVVNEKLAYDPIDRFLWTVSRPALQWNGSQRFRVPEYMTDYFAHQAAATIRANRNRPFFMYLAFNAPHTPFQAKREDYEALSGIKDHKQRVYAAMIRSLDRGVGSVMASLKANGLDDNTLVVFTSDNGGAWYAGLPHINAPYRGWKATYFEGGLRVPFFLRWPARVPAGQRPTAVAQHIDFFATAMAAAGAPLPAGEKIDGINLLPFAKDASAPAAQRTLFWKSGGYRAVRDGDWKLQVSDRDKKTWLFDLRSDPTERNNLAATKPQQAEHLRVLLTRYETKLPKPLWPALVEAPVRIDVPLDATWKPGQEYVYWAN